MKVKREAGESDETLRRGSSYNKYELVPWKDPQKKKSLLKLITSTSFILIESTEQPLEPNCNYQLH